MRTMTAVRRQQKCAIPKPNALTNLAHNSDTDTHSPHPNFRIEMKKIPTSGLRTILYRQSNLFMIRLSKYRVRVRHTFRYM